MPRKILDKYADRAESAAREAGEFLFSRVGRNPAVRNKGAVDLVTEADLGAEEIIVSSLRRAFPEHGIVAEESGTVVGEGEWTWFIDPLDGTTNFTHGYPQCSVSLALARAGEVVVAVVCDPFRRELFRAVSGSGTSLNGSPVRVSATRELSRALVASGFPYNLEQRRCALEMVGLLLPRVQGFRRDGSAALNLAWTACGRLDGYWEFSIQPWDIAAGSLLVTEAGGKVSGFAGEPLDLCGRKIVAGTPVVHSRMVRILKSAEIKVPPQ